MNCINYVDYKHSYAHFIAPKLKTLNYHTNVGKKPVNYVRKIILNILNTSDIKYTDKEQQFYDNICSMTSSHDLYYYCRNSVNKAKETFVYVDDDGELIR